MSDKTYFWLIIALGFFAMSAVATYYGKIIEREYKSSKDKFKKDYGFNTYGLFENLEHYFKFTRRITVIGGVLAGIAAIFSR